MSAQPVERLAFSPREVAAMFGVSPQTVTRWVRDGLLPALETGDVHRTLIPKTSVDAFLSNQRPTKPSERGAA